MNGRQAARAAAEKLQDAEKAIRRMEQDILYYNQCIDTLIKGYSPCPYCEEYPECQLSAKDDGVGCSEWWLAFDLQRNRDYMQENGIGTDNQEDSPEQEEKQDETDVVSAPGE